VRADEAEHESGGEASDGAPQVVPLQAADRRGSHAEGRGYSPSRPVGVPAPAVSNRAVVGKAAQAGRTERWSVMIWRIMGYSALVLGVLLLLAACGGDGY
jgi:hypothetical protein